MVSVVQPLLPEKKARRPRSFGRMPFVLAQLFWKYWKKKRICTTIVTGKYVPKMCKLRSKSRTKMVNATFPPNLQACVNQQLNMPISLHIFATYLKKTKTKQNKTKKQKTKTAEPLPSVKNSKNRKKCNLSRNRRRDGNLK